MSSRGENHEPNAVRRGVVLDPESAHLSGDVLFNLSLYKTLWCLTGHPYFLMTTWATCRLLAESLLATSTLFRRAFTRQSIVLVNLLSCCVGSYDILRRALISRCCCFTIFPSCSESICERHRDKCAIVLLSHSVCLEGIRG